MLVRGVLRLSTAPEHGHWASNYPILKPEESYDMLKVIEGLPEKALGVEATGKITHEDYRDTLIPQAEARMAKGPIRMLYVLRSDINDFALEALWDDNAFGLKHWHDFSHIAVVTDHLWMRSALSLFTPFFPGEVRMFNRVELQTAEDWICAKI
jgi:hypothetical protein